MAFMSIFLLFVVPGMIISAVILGMLICYVLAVYLLEAVAKCLQFPNGGIASWKAFIPFYSDYLWYKLYDLPKAGVAYLLMHVIQVLLYLWSPSNNSCESTEYMLCWAAQILVVLIIFVLNAVQSVKMSKAYKLPGILYVFMIFARPLAVQFISVLELQKRIERKIQ